MSAELERLRAGVAERMSHGERCERGYRWLQASPETRAGLPAADRLAGWAVLVAHADTLVRADLQRREDAAQEEQRRREAQARLAEETRAKAEKAATPKPQLTPAPQPTRPRSSPSSGPSMS